MIIQDQHIRQQALDPLRSFIVQAPAGSGKTELLTQRYLALLSHAHNAPEEIVAITFTRKAAAEMRARILHALEFGNKSEPDKNDYRHTTWMLAQNVLKKDRESNWEIMRNPNRLRILTIDALAAFLCRQTPMLTQFGASLSICENATVLYESAATKLLTETPSDKKWESAIERLLLHVDNHVDNLKKLFSDLLSQREQWLPHILFCYRNHTSLTEYLENSLKNVVKEKMQLAAKQIPQSLKQILLLMARHAGNYFVKNKSDHPIAACADFMFDEKPDLSVFASWFGLATLLLTQKGEWRKSITIKEGFAPNDPNKSLLLSLLTELQPQDGLKDCLNDIVECPPTAYTSSQWETLTALTTILPLLAAQLTLVFREKGQIDFVELNLAALKALGDSESPTDLALYLDYQIRHLLIDEFQDTSVSQLHLLEKLTVGWEQNDGRTLFLVGDPMQSIYRFRNAEVGLFLRAQQQGIGGIYLQPLTLTMNFRSQGNLVAWFNESFSLIFPASPDIPTGRIPYTPAVAAKSATHHFVQCYPIISEQDDDEAKLIAQTIQQLKTENPADSIAILVRSRGHLMTIIQYVRDFQLPFQAIDIEPLADRPEIQDLLSITRALLQRADRIAWLAILRAPWCGLMLTDLEAIASAAATHTVWEAILAAENIAELSENGLQRLQKLRQCMENAFSSHCQLSIAQWIEGVWIMLGGPACLSQHIELDYVRAYFELIEKMEKENPIISIEELKTNCKKLFANANSASATAIQIMTIHKSKGLEFDHVFLPGLHRRAPSNDQQLFRWLDRANALGGDDLLLAPMKSVSDKNDFVYDYLTRVENQKLKHETTRLLYVAATRAKKSLHLFARLKIDEKELTLKKADESSFLRKLESVPNLPFCFLPPKLPEKIGSNKNDDKASLTHTRLTSDWKLPLDFSYTQATETLKKVTINLDIQPLFSRIIGTVIHEMLQTIAQNSMDQFTFQRHQWQARLHTLGILPHEMTHAINIMEAGIQTVLSDNRAQWILSPHQDARCEWVLTNIHDSEQQSIIIDRSFVDAQNTRWIIDYKTATPDKNETVSVFLKDQKTAYQKQLENYATIIAHIDNRPIKLGLYFPLCAQWIEWDYSQEFPVNKKFSSFDDLER